MVFHVHFHIIPRYKDDRHWPRSRAPLRSKLDESDADAQVAAMRARL
jgi:diadenosine tetraphosphate (Ap4A) HIT family hydrolase